MAEETSAILRGGGGDGGAEPPGEPVGGSNHLPPPASRMRVGAPMLPAAAGAEQGGRQNGTPTPTRATPTKRVLQPMKAKGERTGIGAEL